MSLVSTQALLQKFSKPSRKQHQNLTLEPHVCDCWVEGWLALDQLTMLTRLECPNLIAVELHKALPWLEKSSFLVPRSYRAPVGSWDLAVN